MEGEPAQLSWKSNPHRPERAAYGELSRRPAMEMVGEHVLFFIFGLPCTIRRCFQAARGKGALEGIAKVKHFFWLALHRKCWTTARRHRHGLQQSPNCVLCSTGVEEIDHILLSRAFSQQVWHTVLEVLGLVQAAFTAADSFWSWWLHSRKLVSKDLRRGFDSFVFLIGWHL